MGQIMTQTDGVVKYILTFVRAFSRKRHEHHPERAAEALPI
jgi:hypothetical protein